MITTYQVEQPHSVSTTMRNIEALFERNSHLLNPPPVENKQPNGNGISDEGMKLVKLLMKATGLSQDDILAANNQRHDSVRMGKSLIAGMAMRKWGSVSLSAQQFGMHTETFRYRWKRHRSLVTHNKQYRKTFQKLTYVKGGER